MNVLVTTDGSARSLHALPHASVLARATGAKLALLRVLDPLTDCGDQFALKLDEAVEKTTAAWLAAMSGALQEAGVAGQPLVATKARHEDAWDTIIRAANDQRAGIIAMDSRGSGAIRHALLGSVAMGVVGHTELPVMVTGPNIQPAAGGEYRIVATTDGSPASMAVVRAIAPLVAAGEVHVTLLRLCWPGTEEHSAVDCHAQVQALRQQLPDSGRISEEVREVALVSGAGPAIISAAQELGASAIAIATHGHSARYHLFGGSTALSVVQESPLPVILARSVKPK